MRHLKEVLAWAVKYFWLSNDVILLIDIPLNQRIKLFTHQNNIVYIAI